jgi:hypothetical protein
MSGYYNIILRLLGSFLVMVYLYVKQFNYETFIKRY